jgi:hypothetical protein
MKMRVLFLIAVSAAVAHAQSCGRECLRGLLDSYLAAMAKHDASKLNAIPTVKFTENGETLKLGDGFWKTAGPATYRIYALDPQGGAAAVEAAVKEKGELATFMLRIKVQGKAISEAETIVCCKGQAEPFAPQKLTAPPPLFVQMVPQAGRATREQLRAATNAYFTAVETEGTPNYKPAPLADDMNRFENGEQTTNVPVFGLPAASASEQLDKGFFKGLAVAKRRFPVIDTDHGLVLGIGLMSGPGIDGLLLAELFKVSDGKIRQVQAVMVNHPKNGPTGWN